VTPTPNQNPGCNVAVLVSTVVLVAVGGLVAFLVSKGDGEFLPALIVPLIFFFIVIPIIIRAVRKGQEAVKKSSSQSSRPASTAPPTSTHRPYRYDLDTGERVAEPEESIEIGQAAALDEEEHRRVVGEIMARRKREMKKSRAAETPDLVELEPAGDVEYTEEEKTARRRQSRDRSKDKLTDITQSIRERNRQLQAGADTDLPPGYTLCVNCGNITRLTGKKTRCSACGSVIESI